MIQMLEPPRRQGSHPATPGVATPTVLESISVVVPAFNESRVIADSLEQIEAHLAARPAPSEILVVDDGSTDRTADIVAAHQGTMTRLLRQPLNLGKGAAVRAGVLASVMSRVLICDADLSTPIVELDTLEKRIDKAPIVVASRLVKGAVVERARWRGLAGEAFSALMSKLAMNSGVRDTQCGFKLLEGDIARALFRQMTLDGFAFDIELLALARYHNLPLHEVGVNWHESDTSTVRLLRDAPTMLRDVFTVRRRLRQPLPELKLGE